MNKEIFIGLGLFVAVGVGVLYLNQNYVQKNKPVNKVQITTETTMPKTNTSLPINSSEVAKHNSPQDCWIILEGVVYDLSNFSEKHPGGAKAITNSCGTDGSNVFNTRGGKGPHPVSAQETLKNFEVGKLSNN